jgi:hypothetical protein
VCHAASDTSSFVLWHNAVASAKSAAMAAASMVSWIAPLQTAVASLPHHDAHVPSTPAAMIIFIANAAAGWSTHHRLLKGEQPVPGSACCTDMVCLIWCACLWLLGSLLCLPKAALAQGICRWLRIATAGDGGAVGRRFGNKTSTFCHRA